MVVFISKTSFKFTRKRHVDLLQREIKCPFDFCHLKIYQYLQSKYCSLPMLYNLDEGGSDLHYVLLQSW